MAAASSPSPDPAAAPPPAASSNPHRPCAPSPMPPSAHLRPPAFAAKPLTSPPPNKSALDSANRAAMRALSGPARSHTALDQPMPSAYIRRTSPTVAAATPFVSRPQSALVHVPVRQMQAQPQPQPRPQPQPQPQPQPPPHPQPQPQIHPKLPVQQASQPVAPKPAGGGGVPSAPRTIPSRTASKVASFPITSSAPEFNSCKDRERRDDSVVMIHNRKVRLSDGGSGSLYALCRSWIWHGSPQDCQPNYGDGVKLLPRPLPVYSVDNNPSERSERANDAEDLEKEEHVGSAEELSTQDLLAGLVTRSKRVRAQTHSGESLLHQVEKGACVRRSARYNQRLSLLLPPVDMGRVDAAFGS